MPISDIKAIYYFLSDCHEEEGNYQYLILHVRNR